MITCRNCGADVDDALPECPYCHGFLYKGAEAEYMEKLEGIKEDLGNLAQVPKREYKKEAAVHLGKLKRWTVVFVLVIGAAALALSLYGRMKNQKEREQVWAQNLWQQENFPKLDAMFEAGDYDGILEFKNRLYESESDYHTWNWQHEPFMEVYQNYVACKEAKVFLQSETGLDKQELAGLLYEAADILEQKEEAYTQEEWRNIQIYQAEVRQILVEGLSLSEEEILAVRQAVTEKGYVEYEACRTYADKIMEQMGEKR